MRLTFGIVASIFGLQSDIISVNVYISLLLIIVTTSLVASVLLKRLPVEIEKEEILEELMI